MEEDSVVRDGREIVDNIVASLNRHASSSPAHQAEWDDFASSNSPQQSMRLSPTSIRSVRPATRESALSGSVSTSQLSGSISNAQRSSPDSLLHAHASANASSSSPRFANKPRPVAGRSSSGISAGSSQAGVVIGERSSSIFAGTSRMNMEPGLARRRDGDDVLTSASRQFSHNTDHSRQSVVHPLRSDQPRLRHTPSMEPTILDSTRSRTVQKDTDIPSAQMQASSGRVGYGVTPAAITKLMGARTTNSPESSRQSSYNQGNINLTRRSNLLDGASLPDHLYTRGLLGGRHSDITILAFGNEYNLHRLILDRAPFFALALSEPWSEASAQEVQLHPDQVDSAITQDAFELALKRLYGCDITEEEDAEAIGLFATGCWLEMQELIDSSIESILHQMDPTNLATIIKLVTNNYYGRPGERILSSAKAMLCRDGWDMPLKYWDAIPGNIVKEVVSSDGFFVLGEWERWNHAKRLLDRQLKIAASELGLNVSRHRGRLRAPEALVHEFSRFSSHSDCDISRGSLSKVSSSDEMEAWFSVYMSEDVESITSLLDTGIHYIHLEFEQLQYIKQSRDVFGLPVVPDTVTMSAMFQQLELRQKVINAAETDLELGFAQEIEREKEVVEANLTDTSLAREKSRASEIESSRSTAKADTISDPKFWIPSEDCTIVTGGSADPIVSLSSAWGAQNVAMGGSSDESDQGWSDPEPSLNVGARTSSGKSSGEAQAQPSSSSYSTIPPFRFSAEFPAPWMLKEKKRICSRTVFYAGSYWNIYITKWRSVKNNFQLGVYLHRVKDRDQEELISTGPNLGQTSVDERIGMLERDMLFTSSGSGVRHTMPQHSRNARGSINTLVNVSQDSPRSSIASNIAIYPRNRQDRNAQSRFSDATLQTYISFDTDSDTDDSSNAVDNIEGPNGVTGANIFDRPPSQTPLTAPFVPPRISALPLYADTRPIIRTYFKIYSPSKGGRLLSVYESAPDEFDFSHSWGWRSSTLMLDEGFSDEAGDDPLTGLAKKNRDGVLRFSVVIGNL